MRHGVPPSMRMFPNASAIWTTLVKDADTSTKTNDDSKIKTGRMPLSEEQKNVMDLVVDKKKNIFLTGAAGELNSFRPKHFIMCWID